MKDVLVVGYGNTLRSDDGAGIETALQVSKEYPWVETITCHQLGPELAETLAEYATVVFIDASMAATVPVLEPLRPLSSCSITDMHVFGPQELINLSHELFAPVWKSIFALHIPVTSVEFGEHKTKATELFITRGLEMLKHIFIHAQEASSV